MAVSEIGVTLIQELSAASPAVISPPLPLVLIGPGYNIQTRATHTVPETYDGTPKSIAYPGIGGSEYVDVGNRETWGESESIYPVRVYISGGKKLIASSATGYFGSENHFSGNAQTATVSITGFPALTFGPGHVGKSIYIHTGTSTGIRSIITVNATGTDITVSGANFTATEAVNVSVLPTSGQVTRLYSSGSFADVRVGDLIEISPLYTTAHEVIGVDVSANYVDLKTLVAPSANTVSWRATGLFDLVNVTNTLQERIIELASTDFNFDGTVININGSISDPTVPSGVILSGTIKVSYRALKGGLALATGTVNDGADIANDVGISSEVNPLAFGLTKAKENTTYNVNYAGMDVVQDVKDLATPFDGPSKLEIGDVLTRMLDEKDYVKVMLSQYAGHNTQLNAHINQAEDPNGIYNTVSIGIINTGLVQETVITASTERATWDAEGLIEVTSSNDGQLYAKSGRFYSRGSNEFPNFDGTAAPWPVNPLTDLAKLSAGSVASNSGFWQPKVAESMPIRDFGVSAEVAPNNGYWAAYGNRIRSGTFGLTAGSDGGGPAMVRLTGPAGTFRGFLASLPAACRAYLLNRQDGMICTVTAVAGDFSYVDTDIPWDASYAGGAQISSLSDDGIFAAPGLTLSKSTKTDAAADLDAVANTITSGTAGFFAGMVGMWVELSGTSTDDGWHEILSLDGTNTVATVTSITTTEITQTAKVYPVQVNGISGKAEFSGASVSTGHTIRLASRDSLIGGIAKVNASKNITAGASVWGPDDVGKSIRVEDQTTDAIEYLTITAFNKDGTITTDRSVNWSDANNLIAQLSDVYHTDDIDVNILSVDAADEYVTINKSWSQFWLSSGTASMVITGVETLGFGDRGRTVRILNGPYAGQTYTVFAVRPEELVLSIETSFGTGAGLGVTSTAADLNGFAIEFVNNPGNNTFSLKPKTSSSLYPTNESSKVWSIQRDFRLLTITGETFVTKSAVPGDVIRVSLPAVLAGDYVIDTVNSEEQVKLAVGSELPRDYLPEVFDGTTEALTYALVRPKTKDEQASAIADYASAFASRRLSLVWPDLIKVDISSVETTVPGYFASCMVGALASGLAPQQPMSKLGLVGISDLLHSKVDGWFSRVQLNTIASGGVLIIHKDSPSDVPHIRHQLTTDVSSIKTQEISITKILDYISIVIKQEFNVLTGKYNITPELLSLLRKKGQAITQFLENQNDPRAGRLVNEFEFTLIDQSSTNVDEVEAEADAVVPVPFNRMTIRVRA